MKIISSSDNKTVKLIKKLHEKKGRDKENAFLVEGEKLIVEAIENNAEIITLVFRGSEIEGYSIPETTDAVVMTEDIFDNVAGTVTPQQVMAIVRKPEIQIDISEESNKDGYIVLDSLQDPGNVGTIIRTAEAAGFKGILTLKGTADPFSQKVVRAAAGAIFRIPIVTLNSEEQALAYLIEKKIRPIICDASGGNLHTESNLKGNIAFIVGNEGNGISKYFVDNVNESIAIKMQKNSESLNVAIAAAILMFEKNRQEDL